jgi:hypothetical protein
MKIDLKIKAKEVEAPLESGGAISTALQVFPLKDSKTTLKLPKVEVVEMVERFLVYLINDAARLLDNGSS